MTLIAGERQHVARRQFEPPAGYQHLERALEAVAVLLRSLYVADPDGNEIELTSAFGGGPG